MKWTLKKTTFGVPDLMIVLGAGIALGALMNLGGVILGVLVVVGGWGITKLEKAKEGAPDAE